MFVFGLVALTVLVNANKLSSDHHDDDDNHEPTIVLVHGAFQDATGFATLMTELHEHYGYRVIAQSMPGRPANPNPNTGGVTASSPSLADYVTLIQTLVSSLPGRVILVGHSFGGITISQVAQNIPHKILALVYLSAYLPITGDSSNSLSALDINSQLGFAPGSVCQFTTPSAVTALPCTGAAFSTTFCPDCTAAQATAVQASVVAEPIAPLLAPVTLGANFADVKKYYVVTLRDEAISPQLQGLMLTRQHVDKIFLVNAGHLSFETQPKVVAAYINDAANDAHDDAHDHDDDDHHIEHRSRK